MVAPRISPNGQRLLFLRSAEAAIEVVVVDLASGNGLVAATVRHGKSVLDSCDWATDDRLVCSRLSFYGQRADRMPRDGYEFRPNTRLFAIDWDGSDHRDLVPAAKDLPTFSLPGGEVVGSVPHHRPGDEGKHDVVSLLPDDPDHVLVALMRGHLSSVGVWKLNISNNALTPVVPTRIFARDWSADEQGRVRIGTGISDADGARWGHRRIYVEDDAGGFRTVEAAETPQFGSPWLSPKVLGYNAEGTGAYVESHDAESGRLVVLQVHPSTLAVQRRIAAFEDRDAASTAVRGTHCGVVGFAHRAAGTFTWLDADFARDVEALDGKVAGRIHAIPSMSADCSRLVAIAEGGGRTPSVYLHDRGSGQTSRLGERNPALAGRLAERRDVSFKMADGYSIGATLTLPREPTLGAPPLVVMLDAGPLGTAEGYGPWAEFLASRGYAVLEPRVRGLAGFGDEHFTSGFQMWGRRMRDDMASGVRWMTEEGLAAPGRVCYVGRGYGGYMALVGAQDRGVGVRCAAVFGFDRLTKDLYFNDRVDHFNWYWRNWIGRHWKGHAGTTFWNDDNPLRHNDASTLASVGISPLVDAPHPDVPVLLDVDARPQLFKENSRRYRNGVAAAASGRHALPGSTSREAAFLNALEALLEREIGGGG